MNNRVLTMLCLPRACNSLKGLILENIGNISLLEIKEDMLSGSAARLYLEKLAQEYHFFQITAFIRKR